MNSALLIFYLLDGKIIFVKLPVAQLDNAADSDSEERGFESLQAGQKRSYNLKVVASFSFR